MTARPLPNRMIVSSCARDIVNPVDVWDRNDPMWEDARKQAAADGVDLDEGARGTHPRRQQGAGLHVLGAPTFSHGEVHREAGRRSDDLRDQPRRRGRCDPRLLLANFGVAMEIAPQATASVTFTADRPGVHWYYCQWFCHALHMEMRGRMFVEPRAS